MNNIKKGRIQKIIKKKPAMRKQFMNALLPSVANDNVIGLAV